MLFVLVFTTAVASAETVPAKLTMNHYAFTKTPLNFPMEFHVKKTTDGKFVYCTYFVKEGPVPSVTYSKGSKITDNGMNYILKQAYKNVESDTDFFYYQTALWNYMTDKGLMKGDTGVLDLFKSRVNADSSSAANKIKTIVNNAKKASANDTSAPTIAINTSGVKFTYNEETGNYVSSAITVTSSTSKYTVTLSGAPEGSEATIDGNKVVITIPGSKINSLTTKVTINVSNSKNVYTSYYYNPNNNNYQTMAATFKNTKTSKAEGTITLKTTASIKVIKTDESGEALSGAKLQVVNSDGKAVETWTTDGKEHTVSGLSKGNYIVRETEAPAGYILSDQTITFTVNENGTISDSNNKTVTLLTYKNTKTSINVSKLDITNNSELAGATLVIKSGDKEIIKWTSSTKPYVIKGLAAGTYTLEEVNAPSGYILTKEKVTFKIDQYGKIFDKDGKSISKVTMYNSPEKKICKNDNGTFYGKDGNIVTEQQYKDECLKICKNDNGTFYGKNGNVVTEQQYKDECLKICKNDNGTFYGKNGNVVTEQQYKDECLKICKNDNGTFYGKNGNVVTEQQYKDECLQKTIISKKDITTGKELAGATLVVKDYNGNVVDTWVSTNESHVISGLKVGIYTLTETSAPAGYILSSETITFTVKEDSSTTSVVMYNTPDTKEIVPEIPVAPEVPVENTASFKTVTSSIIGTVIVTIGAVILFKTSKKKKEEQ